MVLKIKVNEVAKDIGAAAKEIVEILDKYTGTAHKTTSTLNGEELSIILEYYTQKNQVKSFDEYFAMQSQRTENKADKEETEEKNVTKKQEEKKEVKKA